MLYVFSSRTLMMMALAVLTCVAPRPSYSLTQALLQQQNVGSGVQSYREWKSSKIHETQSKIKSIKEKMGVDPNLHMKTDSSEAGLSQELEREILKLSIIQDLAVSDYFAGYLTKQSSLDTAIKDISSRLTDEEVAELMSAYARYFFQTKPAALKITPRADLSR